MHTVPELLARISELESLLSQALLRISELEKMVADLRVKTNSRNSSMPPSADLTRKNFSLREKSNLKPGGQPGHKGHTSEFHAIPDKILVHKPSECDKCGANLSQNTYEYVTKKQVTDVIIFSNVTEHQIYKTTCSCGHIQQPIEAKLPPMSYGATICTIVTHLSAVHYVAMKRIAEFTNALCGTKMCTGTVQNIVFACGKAAEPIVAEIKTKIENSSIVGGDETGCKVNGKRNWLWILQNKLYTYIYFHPSRGKKVLAEMLPNGLPNAILVTDRYAVYNYLPVAGRQFCIAHLLREVNKLIEKEKTEWAVQFKICLQDIFNKKPLAALQKRISDLLSENLTCSVSKTRTFLHAMRKGQSYLTTCLAHTDIPPDNNASERGIRNLKVKMKVSVQFKSELGARVYANLRSVIDTAKKQNQDVWLTIKNLTNPIYIVLPV